MIKITGAYQREFTFPQDLQSTLDYYGEFDRIFRYLPHISIVNAYGDGKYRLVYHTTELALYQIYIYCDLSVEFDLDQQLLLIRPYQNGLEPVKSENRQYSLIGSGNYWSESKFIESGKQTIIDYQLNLESDLPVPKGLKLMPSPIVQGIARNITERRIQEIAEGFIRNSIRNFTFPSLRS